MSDDVCYSNLIGTGVRGRSGHGVKVLSLCGVLGGNAWVCFCISVRLFLFSPIACVHGVCFFVYFMVV